LASPGSSSRATWKRNSLTTLRLSDEASVPEKVVVRAMLLPVCSSTLCGPVLSLLTPVKFWRLKRKLSWLLSLTLTSPFAM
jgi:hypothetical protein